MAKLDSAVCGENSNHCPKCAILSAHAPLEISLLQPPNFVVEMRFRYLEQAGYTKE